MKLGILAGLFWISFLSATLFPAQFELVLGGTLLYSGIPAWLLIGTAWTGNTAGSCLNWIMGRYASRLESSKWFPASPATISKAKKCYQKYGRWSLALSWAPVIGDPITLVAGILGESFWIFLTIVASAKFIRYIIIAFFILYPAY